MSEGSLYDRELAALAIKQARGDLIEAIFLLRAYRTTLPRFGFAEPLDTAAMALRRRISAAFKDLPGGQVLGPTFDYTHRLLDFDLADGAALAPPAPTAPPARRRRLPRVTDILARDGLIERETPPAAGRAGLRHHPRSAALSRRPRRAAAEPRRAATRAFCSASPIRRSAATAAPIRSSARSASARSRWSCSSRTRLRRPARRDRGHRVPDDQPVQGRRRQAAALYPRLWPGVRPVRAQGDGDGAGRPRAARRRIRRGTHRARRRTRSSCCRIPTTSRRPASSSI